MSPGMCVFLEVGALSWRATRCFFQASSGWKESQVGSSDDCMEKGITEPCELQPDNQNHSGVGVEFRLWAKSLAANVSELLRGCAGGKLFLVLFFSLMTGGLAGPKCL